MTLEHIIIATILLGYAALFVYLFKRCRVRNDGE